MPDSSKLAARGWGGRILFFDNICKRKGAVRFPSGASGGSRRNGQLILRNPKLEALIAWVVGFVNADDIRTRGTFFIQIRGTQSSVNANSKVTFVVRERVEMGDLTVRGFVSLVFILPLHFAPQEDEQSKYQIATWL